MVWGGGGGKGEGVQNKCVNLSSFVQDFNPTIYNST